MSRSRPGGLALTLLVAVLVGCSGAGDRADQQAQQAEQAEQAEQGSAAETASGGRFEDDPGAQAQLQQIGREINAKRDVTRPDLEALETLYARYPDATPVRSLLHQAYVLRFDNEAAIALLERVPPGQRTETEVQLLAQRFITVGRHAEAAGLLEPLQQARPRDLQILNQLGQAYNGLGEFEKTVSMLEGAWDAVLEQQDPGALYLRGQADFQLGRVQPAIEILEQCLALREDHASAHYLLARAYSKVGEAQKAATHQEAFQQLSEASERALARKMRLAAMARETNTAFDEGRYEDCERILKQGLELADPPLQIQLHQYLSRVYEAMGRLEDARASAEAAQRVQQESFNR